MMAGESVQGCHEGRAHFDNVGAPVPDNLKLPYHAFEGRRASKMCTELATYRLAAAAAAAAAASIAVHTNLCRYETLQMSCEGGNPRLLFLSQHLTRACFVATTWYC